MLLHVHVCYLVYKSCLCTSNSGRVIITIYNNNKHLMTGPKGNSEFCFPETLNVETLRPGGRFSKAPETFRARKAIAKSRTLRVQSCFIHIF